MLQATIESKAFGQIQIRKVKPRLFKDIISALGRQHGRLLVLCYESVTARPQGRCWAFGCGMVGSGDCDFIDWGAAQSSTACSLVYGMERDWDEVSLSQEGRARAKGFLHRAFCFPLLGFYVTVPNAFPVLLKHLLNLPPAERAALSG